MTKTISIDVPKNLLTNYSPGDKIELKTRLHTGEIIVLPVVVEEMTKTKAEIIREEFAHLTDKSISLSEASRKYGGAGLKLTQSNFSHWVKAGIIEVKERDGYRVMVREADVAYCAKIYKEKFEETGGNMQGVRLFDSQGNPYQMKYPELAERKRESRRRKRN